MKGNRDMTGMIVDNSYELGHIGVLAYTVGYSGAGLQTLLHRWDDLMLTPEGREEALRQLTRSAEPLNLDPEERACWVAALRKGTSGNSR